MRNLVLMATVLAAALLLVACDRVQPLSGEALALQDAGRLILVESGHQPPPQAVDDRRWRSVPTTTLTISPQIGVPPSAGEIAAQTVTLQAISDGRELALRVGWTDTSASLYDGDATDRFADALAVQFATPDADGALPYIGMGEPARPVTLWYWRAGRDVERLTAHGFGSLERSADGALPTAEAHHDGKGWSVVLRGPLEAPSPALSVAVWEGGQTQRNGQKRFSAWHILHRPEMAAANPALLRELETDGDPEQGRRLAQRHGCTACHRVTDAQQPIAIGPDLRLAGAHHWPGYLRRQIAQPSAFVVPGVGYGVDDGDGGRRSLMPDLPLEEDEIEHLTAWLSGLKPDGTATMER